MLIKQPVLAEMCRLSDLCGRLRACSTARCLESLRTPIMPFAVCSVVCGTMNRAIVGENFIKRGFNKR
jgi:hypothetical protein